MSWEVVAGDQFNWKPGKPGKGLMSGDGSIHTWPTDVTDGPHHGEYAAQKYIDDMPFMFYIDPDGRVHDGGITYMNNTGRPNSSVVNEIMAADPRLHTDDQSDSVRNTIRDEFELPDQVPGSLLDEEATGPDYNFVLGSTDEEAPLAIELKQWLQGIEPQEQTPLSPHHDSPHDIAPRAPESPLSAPPYFPPGHVPDWAQPASEGRTAGNPDQEAKPKPPEPNPDDETTTGGWLRDAEDALIEREISPVEYDALLTSHIAEKRMSRLRRLLRRLV